MGRQRSGARQIGLTQRKDAKRNEHDQRRDEPGL
jgi:hypothetical protein